MRKRFDTPPPSPSDEAGSDAELTGPDAKLIGADETTHRYNSRAIADIRQAISQARTTTEAAPPHTPPPVAAPDAGRRWASELPPMAATEVSALSEVTQRYAEQGVAGIRAAIAAAKGAETETATARRFALGAAPDIKVPSMVIPAAPVAPQTPEDADETGGAK